MKASTQKAKTALQNLLRDPVLSMSAAVFSAQFMPLLKEY
ncbi:protein of unknown function [Ruminococcaceae bacterium BL-4]|nr:protein of unknown function [Ruminococcaceae bacterium BL-4]